MELKIKGNMMIEFISYDGKYPNLCRGVLIVKINGKEVKFGHNYMYYDSTSKSFLNEDKNNPNYESFWKSGGWIKTDKKWNMEAICDEWQLDDSEYTYKNYPQEIKNLLPQLIKLFNEHVTYGCCGGCI